jgi:hypothetical protein
MGYVPQMCVCYFVIYNYKKGSAVVVVALSAGGFSSSVFLWFLILCVLAGIARGGCEGVPTPGSISFHRCRACVLQEGIHSSEEPCSHSNIRRSWKMVTMQMSAAFRKAFSALKSPEATAT